jgi:hypothetical protein
MDPHITSGQFTRTYDNKCWLTKAGYPSSQSSSPLSVFALDIISSLLFYFISSLFLILERRIGKPNFVLDVSLEVLVVEIELDL